MENAGKLSEDKEKEKIFIFTAHEVANVISENYKSVKKILDTMATMGEIEVTEKLVNNRALKGYMISQEDIKKIKLRFNPKKHLSDIEISNSKKMLANALNNTLGEEKIQVEENATNVKFYEVIQENAELTKEVEKLKKDIQDKINTNVQLGADLSIAKSELKFIEDKSKSMESAYAKEKLEVDRLNKLLKNRNITLITLGAIFLVFVTVVITVSILR